MADKESYDNEDIYCGFWSSVCW